MHPSNIRDSPLKEFRVSYPSAITVLFTSNIKPNTQATVTTGKHIERAMRQISPRQTKCKQQQNPQQGLGKETVSSRTQTHMKEEIHKKRVIMAGQKITVFAKLYTATRKNLTISTSTFHKNLQLSCFLLFHFFLTFKSRKKM